MQNIDWNSIVAAVRSFSPEPGIRKLIRKQLKAVLPDILGFCSNELGIRNPPLVRGSSRFHSYRRGNGIWLGVLDLASQAADAENRIRGLVSIAHECVHLHQAESGRLSQDKDYVVWDGRRYPYIPGLVRYPEYDVQGWEQDANLRGIALVRDWLENRKQLSADGRQLLARWRLGAADPLGNPGYYKSLNTFVLANLRRGMCAS